MKTAYDMTHKQRGIMGYIYLGLAIVSIACLYISDWIYHGDGTIIILTVAAVISLQQAYHHLLTSAHKITKDTMTLLDDLMEGVLSAYMGTVKDKVEDEMLKHPIPE